MPFSGIFVFFLVIVPAFFASSCYGQLLISDIGPLGHIHPSRGAREVNLLGFLVLSFGVVLPVIVAASVFASRPFTWLKIDKSWGGA